MNRAKLKSYAPQARREFIQAVTGRAAYYGLTARNIEPISEAGDTAIIAGHAFPRSLVAKRRALEERIRRQGFAQVIEAMAYTWFNRLVAIRFMELHGYLDHGYRVLSHTEGRAAPEILEHAEHVQLPELDRDRVIEMKLDGNREAELYRMLLVAQCNALHAAMPFLFEKIDDETELLLPDNLLHTDSIVRRLVREIDEADWQQVEIIGWLYQFYISEKKDEVIGKVVRSEDIPAATQLFTPNWIVKYMAQNSIGRMWLATYPQSGLRAKMDYYIEPAEQTAEVQAQLAAITPTSIDPETITVLDPACGSGHILVEAYDLLKEIYLERGYRLRDIPRLILKRNLYGLDIDDRAAQLAAFALLMKARADDRRIFETTKDPKQTKQTDGPQLNVFAIQESNTLDAAALADALLNVKSAPRRVPVIGGDMLFDDLSMQPALMMSEGQGTGAAPSQEAASREEVIELVELFRQGKTLGSLISVPDELAAKLPAIARAVNENLHSGDLYAQDAARALLPFVQQADILARKYDCVIANPPYMGSKGMNAELKKFATHNFAASKADLFAMFIKRCFGLAEKAGFNATVTMQSWMFLTSFEELRSWIIKNSIFSSLVQIGYNSFPEMNSKVVQAAMSIFQNVSVDGYRGVFINLNGASQSANKQYVFFESKETYFCNPEDFAQIPGSPFTYWIKSDVRNLFQTQTKIYQIADPRKGLDTGDNESFLRRWYEIDTINASLNGEVFTLTRWFPCQKGGSYRKWYGNHEILIDWQNNGERLKKHPKSTVRNEKYYFREGITWSTLTSSNFAVRYSPKGFIFESKGAICFPINQLHLTPLLSFGNSIVANYLLSLICPTLDYHEGYVAKLPITIPNQQAVGERAVIAVAIAREDWDSFEISWNFQTFPMLSHDLKAATVEASFNNWQAQCNANIKRMQELETENNRLFINAYGLEDELTPDVPEDQITLARADREADIKRLLSYAVGCAMGRYSLDQAGLVYAHSGNRDFDAGRYQTFAADPDGIVPVMENDWFDDDAAHRFVEFVAAAWPAEQLEDNLRFIAASLAANRNETPRETIRRYLATGFFKDHLKTYKKRPIYWLFTSGRQRAFQALVYLHRYNDGTLARMRTEYVIPLQGKVAARIEHLAADITDAASTAHRRKLEKEREALTKQQDELRAFDEKLRHSADQRIALDLDDGVKVNYGKFGDLLADVKAITGGHED